MISPCHRARGLAWALLSLVVFMVALFGIFPVLAAAQAFGEIPHAAQLAIWSASWGVLSIGGVLLAARLTLGRWLSITPIAMVLAGAGVVLSAIVHVVLQQWEIQRFGVAEPEHVGLTAALFALLIGLATATFGTLVAPRGDRAWPAAATIVGAVMVLAIVALNLPGLDDGLGTESLPLAIWLGLSAVYGFVTAVAALSRLRGTDSRSKDRDPTLCHSGWPCNRRLRAAAEILRPQPSIRHG